MDEENRLMMLQCRKENVENLRIELNHVDHCLYQTFLKVHCLEEAMRKSKAKLERLERLEKIINDLILKVEGNNQQASMAAPAE